jgi:hypothetical protein
MPRDRFKRWGARHSRVKRQLRNPYFQKKGANVSGRWAGWRGLGIAALYLVGAAALVILPAEAVTNSVFSIETITYTLPNILPERQVRVRAAAEAVLETPLVFGLSKKNFFLFPTTAVKESIQAQGPFEKISVQKKFPRTVTISVAQAVRVFSVSDGRQTAFVDGDGGVLDVITTGSIDTTTAGVYELRESVSSTAAALIPVVIENERASTTIWRIGEEILQKNCATLISFFDAGLSAVELNGTVYQVSEDKTRVSIFTREGATLLTDPIVSPRDQLNRLIALLLDARYKNRATLESIDLRYPGKVYVVQKGS